MKTTLPEEEDLHLHIEEEDKKSRLTLAACHWGHHQDHMQQQQNKMNDYLDELIFYDF